MNTPPRKIHRRVSVSFMINLPSDLMKSVDKYINERRFETRSEMIAEALQTWIDCEEDEDLWEVAQKHDENPADFGCLDDEET
jgi:Arc/MetJ-type ribon-helix-helix transcriptional regulator